MLSDAARRIFIGSIPSTVTENDIKKVGSRYGSITSFHYMVAPRGWALLTYSTVSEAANAIEGMNGKYLFPSCKVPIVARLANERPNEKKFEGTQPNSEDGYQNSVLPLVDKNSTNVVNQIQSNMPNCNFVDTDASYHKQWLAGAYVPCMPGMYGIQTSSHIPGVSDEWFTYYTTDGHPYYYSNITKKTQWEIPTQTMPNYPLMTTNPYAMQPMINTLSPKPRQWGEGLSSSLMSSNIPQEVLGARKYGPPGCNLFIFHIPSEWGHAELYEHFKYHGNIISARVKTVENSGNRNLGFGFVSYDTQEATIAAIKAMHGVHVSGKWLKVTLKKGEEHLLPPSLQSIYTKGFGQNKRMQCYKTGQLDYQQLVTPEDQFFTNKMMLTYNQSVDKNNTFSYNPNADKNTNYFSVLNEQPPESKPTVVPKSAPVASENDRTSLVLENENPSSSEQIASPKSPTDNSYVNNAVIS